MATISSTGLVINQIAKAALISEVYVPMP